ncbi:hypothetical protein ACIQCG_39060 [Streptomyces noursei]|uniref:hypothetical protein n=1 Tax=Streptomyces noursei TaxID=1971 RepID=UPI0037F152A3
MDSRVQLRPGALAALLSYIDERPDSSDLIQGALLNGYLQMLHTHWDPVWYQDMYGRLATDPRGTELDGSPSRSACKASASSHAVPRCGPG